MGSGEIKARFNTEGTEWGAPFDYAQGRQRAQRRVKKSPQPENRKIPTCKTGTWGTQRVRRSGVGGEQANYVVIHDIGEED